METYNYMKFETPIFERTELFDRGVGNQTDIVSKEMYSWTDQGGENLTLKPELTLVSGVRLFNTTNLGNKQPLTKLYIQMHFLEEKGRKKVATDNSINLE